MLREDENHVVWEDKNHVVWEDEKHMFQEDEKHMVWVNEKHMALQVLWVWRDKLNWQLILAISFFGLVVEKVELIEAE